MPQSLPITPILFVANLLKSIYYTLGLHFLYSSSLLNQLQSSSCLSTGFKQLVLGLSGASALPTQWSVS